MLRTRTRLAQFTRACAKACQPGAESSVMATISHGFAGTTRDEIRWCYKDADDGGGRKNCNCMKLNSLGLSRTYRDSVDTKRWGLLPQIMWISVASQLV